MANPKSFLRSRGIAAALAVGTFCVPLAAHAATQITLGGTAAGITLTGTGTLVNGVITAGTGDGTLLNGLGSVVAGNYILGAVSFTAGPNTAEQYPVTVQTPASQAFSYSDSAGNALIGDIHWSFLQDNTTNPKFFGSMTVLTSSGVAAFTSVFIPGSSGGIDLTTTALGGGRTLDQLVATSGTATVGISSGEAVAGGVPSQVPVPGALPLFVTGLGALGLLGSRRKKKAAARAA